MSFPPPVITDNEIGIVATGKYPLPSSSGISIISNPVQITPTPGVPQPALTVDGVISVISTINDTTGVAITEQITTPVTPGNDQGVLWVRDDNPTVLVFTNSDGVDIDIGTPAIFGTLQTVYDNSGATPIIVLDDADGGIFIRDDTGPPVTGSLFAVQNNGGTTSFLDVRAGTVSIESDVTITGSATITQDLSVLGTVTSFETQIVLIEDNFIHLNAGYDQDTPLRAGQVYNIDPDPAVRLSVDAPGFTAGVAAVSNPTVATLATGVFSDGDFVVITGANSPDNNGIFEVLSDAGNVLTIRGVGTSANTPGIDFVQTQFSTDSTVAGTITLLDVSVFRARTDGEFESGSGSTSAAINSSFSTFVKTLNDVSGVGDESIIGDGTGPDLSVKKISAGPGIILTSDADQITVENSSGGTFVGLSDTPGSYAGNAQKLLSVNNAETDVIFNNNLVGINTEAGGTSISLGALSTVGGNSSAVAIGNTASVTATGGVALGLNSISDIENSLVMGAAPMMQRTSATAITLGAADMYPGSQAQWMSDIFDLRSAPSTTTWTLPTNTRFFVDQIDVIKTDAADPGVTPGDYTIGGDAGAASFVPSTSIGGGSENVIHGRQSFIGVVSQTGTNTFVFDHTTSVTGGANPTYNVRIVFKGTFSRIE